MKKALLLLLMAAAASLFPLDTLSSANFKAFDFGSHCAGFSDTSRSANFRQRFGQGPFVGSDGIGSANFITSLGIVHFLSDSAPAQQPDVNAPVNSLVLTVSGVNDTSLTLRWDPAVLQDNDAESLKVVYSDRAQPTTHSDPSATVGARLPLTSNQYLLKGLKKGTPYYFAIYVADTAGNWSDAPSSARVMATTTGGTIFSLLASASTESTITLVTTVFGAKNSTKSAFQIIYSDSGYIRQQSDSLFAFGTSPVLAVDRSKDTAISRDTLPGLAPGAAYYFTLYVFDSLTGWTAAPLDSASRTTLSPPGTPDTLPPGNNLTLVAKALNDSSIVVRWNPDTLANLPDIDIDSLYLFMRTGSYRTFSKGDTTTPIRRFAASGSGRPDSFVVKPLKKDTVYYFSLYVVDDSLNASLASARDTAVIKPAAAIPPANDVTVNAIGLNSSTIQVTFVPGPQSYDLRDTVFILMSTDSVPTSFATGAVVGKFPFGTDSTLLMTGLFSNTPYYFSAIVKSESGLFSTVPAAARGNVTTQQPTADRDTFVTGTPFIFALAAPDTVSIPKSLGGGTAVQIRIPSGSVPAGAVLSIVQFPSDTLKGGSTGYTAVGPVYDLDLAGGDTLRDTVIFVLTLDPTVLLGGNIRNLVFFNYNELLNEWQMVAGGVYDSAARTFTVSLAHFSLYQLMNDSVPPYTTTAGAGVVSVVNAARTLTMNVVDNTSQTPTVTLHVRQGGQNFSTATALTLDTVAAANGLWTYQWTANLAGTQVTANGLSYRVISRDLTGRADTALFNAPVLLPSATKVSAKILPGFENEDSLAWRMVSFPAQLSSNTLNAAFSFAGADTGAFRVYRYRTAQNNYQRFTVRTATDKPDPGKAYWILTEKAVDSLKVDTSTASSISPFSVVSLDSGWNQIGNPYLFPVTWSDVLAANGTLSSGDLPSKPREWRKGSSGHTFVTVDTLAAWKGYFLYASKVISLKIPSGPLGTGKEASPFKPGAGSFFVDLSAVGKRQAEMVFRLGTSPAAGTGIDPLDVPKLPSLVNEIELFALQTDGRKKPGRFEEIWKPAEPQGQRFTFEVTTAGAQKVTLSTLPTTALPESYVVFAADRARRVKFDLTGQPYTFFSEKASSNSFLLAAGTPVFVAQALEGFLELPTHYALSPNHPNPFNPATEIRFSIPSAPAGAVRPPAVQLHIYDLRGRLVRTLLNKPMSAGYYTVRWDGKGENQKTTASGVYFYRLTGGKFVKTRKMILSK